MTDDNKDNHNKDNDKYIIYKNDLKYRKFRELDESKIIFNSSDVKQLYKSDLDTIDYRLHECEEEKYITLDLKCINLNEFPNLSHKIKNNLQFLFLGDNNLREFPNLSEFNSLEMLEINHNKIKNINHIPHSLFELCCRENLIDEFVLSEKHKLERLDIRHNHLHNIILSQNIKILDIGFNNLSISIGNMYNLEKLLCSHNQIKEIYNCPKLSYLDCKSNPINSIKDCQNIEHIVCSNTLLNSLPYSPNIQTIECFHTNINELPYCKKLYELLCDNGQINKISSKYKIKSAEVYKDKIMHIIFDIENTT